MAVAAAKYRLQETKHQQDHARLAGNKIKKKKNIKQKESPPAGDPRWTKIPKLAAISEYGNPQEDQQWYFDVFQPVPPNISAEQLDLRAQELVDAGILGEECYEDTDSDQGDSEGEEALGAVASRYLEAAAVNPLDSEVEHESQDVRPPSTVAIVLCTRVTLD